MISHLPNSDLSPNPSPIRGGETLTLVDGGERSNLNDKSFTEHDIINQSFGFDGMELDIKL